MFGLEPTTTIAIALAFVIVVCTTIIMSKLETVYDQTCANEQRILNNERIIEASNASAIRIPDAIFNKIKNDEDLKPYYDEAKLTTLPNNRGHVFSPPKLFGVRIELIGNCNSDTE